MPFGGEDEERQKHFLGVYQTILAAAAQRAGYVPKRSDLGGGPGNITGGIILDLLNADVVIADLTGGNANVLFELGIRHVFRKNGTVHVVDSTRQIPFDIQQYRAIKYTTDLADIPDVIDRIVDSIKQREEQVGLSDNPVHDTVPDLPNFIRDISEAAQIKRMAELQATLERVQADNDRLTAKLLELDPAGVLDSMPTDVTVDKLLNEADEVMKSTGEYVMFNLAQRANEEGREGFVAGLKQVLKSPYLSENDFMSVARMCVTLGLAAHRQAVLEIAHSRYPHEDQLTLALIDAYDDSANAAIKERGRLMAESFLRLERGKDELPRLGDTSSIAASSISSIQDALALLFNFYFKIGKPEWVLSTSESALERNLDNEVVSRNKARALQRMGRTEEAETAFTEAIEKFSTDPQSLQWYSDFLDDQRRYPEAYEYSEKGVIAASDEPSLYTNHAIEILNHGYARTASGKIEGPLTLTDQLPYVLPLLSEAIARSANSAAVTESVVNIMIRRNRTREAQAFMEGTEPPGRQDRSALEYILQRVEELRQNN
ncbi:MAG TPA: tetratricopeptide repeat protein [Streptosporangiaceae bacterium]|nr:tetratricopeptide repeat protein [Streptosporangiaceae bacterium]